jgi:hypothetical protein
MRTFFRFLFAACAASWIANANAVYVSPDGVGQALIYPYFTAQSSNGGDFNTYLSISNGQTPKAVRVRFREGRNGRELLGFNLLLGSNDTWAASIVPTAEGARLLSRDSSCAVPAVASRDFSDASFTGTNADGQGEDRARLREGYVEVLEMASFSPAPTCEAFQAHAVSLAAIAPPADDLAGTLTLINVANGMDFTMNAEALAQLASRSYFRPVSDPYPDWNINEIDPVAAFFRAGTVVRPTFTTPLAAVEAAMMRGLVRNEVIMDAGTRSGTDWVLTMPTRRLHNTVNPSPFVASALSGEMSFRLQFTPRDGSTLYIATECDFLCLDGNYRADLRIRGIAGVISFRRASAASAVAGISDVLGASRGWIVNLPTAAENGSARVDLGGLMDIQAKQTRLSDGENVQYISTLFGIPVTGFMVRSLRNDAVTCGSALCQSNYGGAFPHKYDRQMYPVLP